MTTQTDYATNDAHAPILDENYLTRERQPDYEVVSRKHSSLAKILQSTTRSVEEVGRIVKAFGTTVHVSGITAGVGQRCVITDNETGKHIYGDVVGLNEHHLILYLLGSLDGISNRSEVRVSNRGKTVPFSETLKGCILDGTGRLIYQPHALVDETHVPIERPAPDPLTRTSISTILTTGVKVVDALLTVGQGQRMGIFASAGVGKSTLLSMLARHSETDAIVIGLIGERGREVREFIEHNLGKEGLSKSVIIAATSDRPALERVNAAQTATTIAEGFRAHGQNVLLLIDSVTRYARALREIGLSVGEPPSRRGYPPSVFAELPKLLERSGNNETGSITAFYTVLEEDEDSSDPVAEEVKSSLDGHIVLSRQVAESGQYPPIDILPSTSRLFRTITSETHGENAQKLRNLLSTYKENELLLSMGEYKSGSDPLMDLAIKNKNLIDQLLGQTPDEFFPMETTLSLLREALD